MTDMAGDTSQGLAYYLTSSTNQYSTAFDQLAVVDTKTFLPLSLLPLPFSALEGATASGVDVVRWGQDGLAILTSKGRVYLMHGGLITPQLLTTASAAALTASSATTIAAGSGNTSAYAHRKQFCSRRRESHGMAVIEQHDNCGCDTCHSSDSRERLGDDQHCETDCDKPQRERIELDHRCRTVTVQESIMTAFAGAEIAVKPPCAMNYTKQGGNPLPMSFNPPFRIELVTQRGRQRSIELEPANSFAFNILP